jgi:hypothetical protein
MAQARHVRTQTSMYPHGSRELATLTRTSHAVSEYAAFTIAKGRWTMAEAGLAFVVSQQMIRYRLNATPSSTSTWRIRDSSFVRTNQKTAA